MWRALAAFVLLLGGAGSASAQTRLPIRINGVEIQLTVPDGYCLPTGADVDAFQTLAAADRHNVTHLSLTRCGGQPEPAVDYILIKTPRQMVLADIGREELLQAVRTTFDSPEFSAVVAAAPDSEGENLSSVLGRRVDLSGDLGPRGLDGLCGYLGGTMQVASGPLTYSISMGGCITAVGRRVVTVSWYGPDRGSEGVAALIVRARQLAAGMSASPAP